jgi:hypothetical protein
MKVYGGIAPYMYNIGIRWRSVVSFTSPLLYPPYPLNKRLSESFKFYVNIAGEKNKLTVPGIESR